jgi:MFS family permease
VSSEPEPRLDGGLSRRRRPTGNFADGLRSMRGLPRVVWVLGVASLLNDVSSEAIFPLLPLFLQSLGAPMGFLGLIEGSADALSSVLKVVAGRLSDRGPRRGFVAGGYAIPAIARAGIAAALTRWHVLAARLVDRTGKGIRSGPRDAMIAESVPPSQRGRAFGLNRSMDHFGGMVAPIILALRLREEPHDGADRSGPVDAAAGSGSLRHGYSSYLVACVLFALGNSSDVFLLVRAHEVGWSGKALPLLWAFHHLVKSLAAVPGGTLSDRHSRGMVVSFGWAAYALTYVGFGFASERWQILALFLVYALYHGLAEGAERAIVADLSDRGARGRWSAPRRCPPASARAWCGIAGALRGRWARTPRSRPRPRRSCSRRRSAARCAAGRPRRAEAPRIRLRASAPGARAGRAAARAARSAASRRPGPRRSRP